MNSEHFATDKDFLEWDAHCTIEEQPRGCTSCKLAELDAVPGGHLKEIMRSLAREPETRDGPSLGGPGLCPVRTKYELKPSSIAQLKIQEWNREEAALPQTTTNKNSGACPFPESEACPEGRSLRPAQRPPSQTENKSLLSVQLLSGRALTGGDAKIIGKGSGQDSEKRMDVQGQVPDGKKVPLKSRSPNSRYEGTIRSGYPETERTQILCTNMSRIPLRINEKKAETSNSNQAKAFGNNKKENDSHCSDARDPFPNTSRKTDISPKALDDQTRNKLFPNKKQSLSPNRPSYGLRKTQLESPPAKIPEKQITANKECRIVATNQAKSASPTRTSILNRQISLSGTKQTAKALSPVARQTNKTTKEEKPLVLSTKRENKGIGDHNEVPNRNEMYRYTANVVNPSPPLNFHKTQENNNAVVFGTIGTVGKVGSNNNQSARSPNAPRNISPNHVKGFIPLNVKNQDRRNVPLDVNTLRGSNRPELSSKANKKNEACVICVSQGSRVPGVNDNHPIKPKDSCKLTNSKMDSQTAGKAEIRAKLMNTRDTKGTQHFCRTSSNADSVYLSADDADDNDAFALLPITLVGKNSLKQPNCHVTLVPPIGKKIQRHFDWERNPVISYTDGTSLSKSYPSFHVLDKILERGPLEGDSDNDSLISHPSEFNGKNKYKICNPKPGSRQISETKHQKTVDEQFNSQKMRQLRGPMRIKPKKMKLLKTIGARTKLPLFTTTVTKTGESFFYHKPAKSKIYKKQFPKKFRALLKQHPIPKFGVSKVLPRRKIQYKRNGTTITLNEVQDTESTQVLELISKSPKVFDKASNVEKQPMVDQGKGIFEVEPLNSTKKEVAQHPNINPGHKTQRSNNNSPNRKPDKPEMSKSATASSAQPNSDASDHIQRLYTSERGKSKNLLPKRANALNPQKKREMFSEKSKNEKLQNSELGPSNKLKSPVSSPNNTELRSGSPQRDQLAPVERRSFLKKNTGYRTQLHTTTLNNNREEKSNNESLVVKENDIVPSSNVKRISPRIGSVSPPTTKVSPMNSSVRGNQIKEAVEVPQPKSVCPLAKFRTCSPPQGNMSSPPQRFPTTANKRSTVYCNHQGSANTVPSGIAAISPTKKFATPHHPSVDRKIQHDMVKMMKSTSPSRKNPKVIVCETTTRMFTVMDDD